jgi:hypothetical protein
MRKQPKRSQPILCLIDGYLGSLHEGRIGKGSMTPGQERKLALLDRYPGRWAVVHARERAGDGYNNIGTHGPEFVKHGYEVAVANGKTYARRPHPSGRPLSDFVTKMPAKRFDPMPAVESDEFGWSRDELANAAATARAWLFPIEGIAA